MPDGASAADWVSSVGSLGAVIAAIWVSRIDGNRARANERKIAEATARQEREFHSQLTDIVDRIRSTASLLVNLLEHDSHHSEGKLKSEFDKWLNILAVNEAKLIRLQAFPSIPLPYFLAYDRVLELIRKMDVRDPLSTETLPRVRTIVAQLAYLKEDFEASERGLIQAPDTRLGT